jgi:glycosyltransferase involved in cell wall biosynthesis
MEGPRTSQVKAVIAHDFTEVYGGAERIVAAIAEVFPDAPFWSILGHRSVTRRMSIGDRAHTVLPSRERLVHGFRALTPLYPAIVRARRLPAADVLVTSSYAFAHGFRTENDAPQVCYCYSPLRFAWSMTGDYEALWATGRAPRAAFRGMAAVMRAADRKAARRVTTYVAESDHIAEQIRRFYGREPEVIYPPVDCELFRPGGDRDHDDYFLICGRLIEPYKRFGIAIDAFRELPHRLLVAGDGPAYAELSERAGDNVEFLGGLDDDALVPVMQRAAATLFPSTDDFGLIPVESMACGRPVIAFAAGGALETVKAGETGEFFDRTTPEAIRAAVAGFDPDAYDAAAIRAHAENWALPRFQRQIREVVERTALTSRS